MRRLGRSAELRSGSSLGTARSHGTLYFGERKTIVKDRKKELVAPCLRTCSANSASSRETWTDDGKAGPSVETLAWPAMLVADDQRRVQVRFPVSRGSTDGADDAEALAEAADCLAEAVAARIADEEDLPAPSPLRRGMHPIPLPPLLAYKAALFSAMRRDRVSKSELARSSRWTRRTSAG